VFADFISDGKLHPTLQTPATFAASAAVFPDLARLVVHGVAQVANVAAKHVASTEANDGMPHQAMHTDPPSPCARTIVVCTVTLSVLEISEFSAKHANGIVFSKNSVESHAVPHSCKPRRDAGIEPDHPSRCRCVRSSPRGRPRGVR
jgi:hypothetical protein